MLLVPVGHEVLFLDRVARRGAAAAAQRNPCADGRDRLGPGVPGGDGPTADAVAAGLVGHRSAVRHDVGAIVQARTGSPAKATWMVSCQGPERFQRRCFRRRASVAAISVSAMASRMCGDPYSRGDRRPIDVCAEIGELSPD